MKYLMSILLLALSLTGDVIFDFSSSSDLRGWQIVDDGIMGGRSSGELSISDEGHGVFSGTISLENNGGFSSARYGIDDMPVDSNSALRIRIQGDGSTYQLRIKHNRRYEYSYVQEFKTTGEWQEIDIAVADMYPVYRGRRLNRPNFNYDSMEEVTFLIGNGRAQSFRLLIDNIELITK